MKLTGEEQGNPCNDLVEAQGGVKGHVSVEKGAAEERDGVAAHGHQKRGVGEHHGAGSTSSDSHTVTSDTTKSSVLPLNRVICEQRILVFSVRPLIFIGGGGKAWLKNVSIKLSRSPPPKTKINK